jgi:WD40 repeat protein
MDPERWRSGGLDHTARMWDIRAQRLVATFKGHTSRVFSVNYAPDGKTIVTGSMDGTARIWDAAATTEAVIFDRHPGNIATVEFSANGRLLLRADRYGKQVTVWDAVSSKKLAVILHEHASFSPDGRLMVTTSAPNVLTVWDVSRDAPRQLRKITLASLPEHRPVFLADSRRVVVDSATNRKAVDIWGVGGRRERTLRADAPDKSPNGALDVSRDGRLLAMGYDDGRVGIWDARTWSKLTVLRGHSQPVLALAFSPDGQLLATASADTTVRLWPTDFSSEPAILTGDAGGVYALAFAPDGNTLAVGTVDGVLKFWNVRARREVATLKAHGSIVSSIAFSPNGRMLATIGVDQTMRLWHGPAFAETDRSMIH